MSTNFINYDFAPGFYRVRVKVSYKDANNQTYTKKSAPYTFVAVDNQPEQSTNNTNEYVNNEED